MVSKSGRDSEVNKNAIDNFSRAVSEDRSDSSSSDFGICAVDCFSNHLIIFSPSEYEIKM